MEMLLLLLIVAVILGPVLIARTSLRDAVLQAAMPRLKGRISSGGARLGWWYPVEFEQIVVRGGDGQPVLSIGELKGDRPLWKLLLWPHSAGNFLVENARLDVALTAAGQATEPAAPGNNLAALLGGGTGAGRAGPNVGCTVQIVGGTLAVHGPGNAQPWIVAPVNLAMELAPPASGEGAAELVFAKGPVVDHVELTSPVCGELLKYVLPVLSETTGISGQFSVALDGWRVPLDDPGRATGSGQFSIHRMDVSSMMLQRLSESLHIPPTVRLAEGSVVQFKMAGRRVEHQGLTFGTPQLMLRTQGSVGLDQSLDLLAEIAVNPALGGQLAQAPLLKQTLQIPIHGTFTRPRADLRQAGQEMLQNVIGDVLKLKLSSGREFGEELQRQAPLAPGGAIDQLLKRQSLEKLFGDRK
jgi:hypothetical protein